MPSNAFADLPMTEKIHRSLDGTPDAPFRDMLSHVDNLAALVHGTWAPSSDAERGALDAYERDFLSRFAYHTTVIEGSTLTPIETKLVIEGELVPSDDRVGYYEALEAWQADGEFGPLVALGCASVAAECEGRIACVRETRENEARLKG